MMVSGGKFLVVLVLVTMLGAHWAVLQTLAWTTMLADNLQSESLETALVKTFDGKHPCPLCRAIAEGKKSERKTEFTVSTSKFEYPPTGNNVTLFPPAQFEYIPTAEAFPTALAFPPLTPPPRAA